MSSRFVSAGTINGDGRITATTTTTTTTAAATAAVPAPPSLPPAGEKATSTPTPTPSRPEDQQQQQAATAQWETKAAPKINSEWEAVTRDLEADRRRREEARRALVEGGSGGGDRSLFEVLQANKAAKQAAFEEQNRIRNQFRALDDDEIDFLEGVRDERRTEEERVRRETEERLARFRAAQRGSAAVGDDDELVGVAWSGAGKKRKRAEKEGKGGVVVKGVKRRVSVGEKDRDGDVGKVEAGKEKELASGDKGLGAKSQAGERDGLASVSVSVSVSGKQAQEKPRLGLVDYGSDEEDDD